MGLYKLEKRPNGLFVLLSQGSKDKTLSILKQELLLRNIEPDFKALEKWIEEDSQEPFKLTEEVVDLNGRFTIRLSEDLLTAYLTFFPAIEGQLKISLDEIKKSLISKGVTYGVDEVKIMLALTQSKITFELPIAKGSNPIPGKNAKIKYFFNEKGIEVKPKELENGKVDFYNMNLIQIVKKGQILIEKIPATPGIPGITVTGQKIPAINGKNIILPVGKNLIVSQDSLKAYAGCEGHVVIVERRVSVLPVFEVNGDVDFSTGNIDFTGNVIIKGNIKDGFNVKSNGDVEVYGSVEGGNIFALGNIFIKKGIRGLKKSKLKAQGSIYSNFVEHACLDADGDVIITEAIMHSTVNSGSTIQVGGRRGLVVGGTCRAGRALICKNIGSQLATFTTIEVGLKPEIRLEYKDICQNLVLTKKNLENTRKALRLLEEMQDKLGNLPTNKIALLKKLVITKGELEKQIEDMLLHKEQVEFEIKELDEGYVQVSGVINCGVNITIGRANKHFTSEMYKVTLRQKGVDISISPLNEEKGA